MFLVGEGIMLDYRLEFWIYEVINSSKIEMRLFKV